MIRDLIIIFFALLPCTTTCSQVEDTKIVEEYYRACLANDYERLKVILYENQDLDIHWAPPGKSSCLYLAVKSGNQDIIDRLLLSLKLHNASYCDWQR